jgi:hypothetical protein
MSTSEQSDRDLEQQRHNLLAALITKQVIGIIGEPTDLLNVQVHELWEDHYRVNVLVGWDAAAPRFANSYFVVIDEEGNILSTTPSMTRRY